MSGMKTIHELSSTDLTNVPVDISKMTVNMTYKKTLGGVQPGVNDAVDKSG